ncbi:MAG: hypothetical protein PHR43_01320 [Dehalococcoidales bacterium]|nr:hypothetical protein [Dehalococcoidales bacterium]
MKEAVNINQLLDGFQLEIISQTILEWWNSSGRRNFPWRETHDPFKVMIAEILLHRTRAEQVVPLYQVFIKKYSDVHAIARSSPDELEESFRSAGLHWRWKLLHAMSIDIETRFNGQIPHDFEDLTSLLGVSHYIASAVRCFAFGYPDVLLDTNTVRVSGRIFGLPITDSSRRSILFRKVIQRLMDAEQCSDFNFALIDFAAKVCRLKKPHHDECPICESCVFYQKIAGVNKNTKINTTPLKEIRRSHQQQLSHMEAL